MKKLIKEECFNLQWLKSKSRKLSGDPVLLEKTLHAFALLGDNGLKGYKNNETADFLEDGIRKICSHLLISKT